MSETLDVMATASARQLEIPEWLTIEFAGCKISFSSVNATGLIHLPVAVFSIPILLKMALFIW